jgi:hypothetical protein
VACLGAFRRLRRFFGLTEGVEKALVATSHRRTCGVSFGLYHLIVGVGAFPASLIFGCLAEIRFRGRVGMGAALALAAISNAVCEDETG